MTLTSPGLAISEAKQRLGALVDQAHLQHAPVSLSKRGKRVAVIVDAGEYDRMLERLEEIEDAEAAVAARAELEDTQSTPIPWDEVKAELGLS
ncbi:type II toxin-antitoxin system Phd/YefM family antitoxin [Leifsonia sp. NPDC080035]|uniref:Antitoxin n=1 Tax=Leifsonia sp. NPDC080035 TaxID=3143936 RepID=A0AAU7GER6_9MICO